MKRALTVATSLLVLFAGTASAAVPAATVRDCPDCPQMTRVDLTVGGAHRSLLVSTFELTWGQYLASAEAAGCAAPRNRSKTPVDWRDRRFWDDYPMTSIQPNEITCYVRWLNAKTGKAYRLPTEAEWMAIAISSGGKAGRGDYLFNRVHDLPVRRDPRSVVANRVIRPVSLSGADALGLHDLFGNAAEAVSDFTPPPPQLRTRGAGRIQLVTVKGGYIGTPAGTDLVKDRMRFVANTLSDMIGFRVVRPID